MICMDCKREFDNEIDFVKHKCTKKSDFVLEDENDGDDFEEVFVEEVASNE